MSPTSESDGVHHHEETLPSSSPSSSSRSPRMESVDDEVTNIPEKYLNSFGFVDYDHYGNVPWLRDDPPVEVILSESYKSLTRFLAVDCEMVGVGELEDSELARVSIVNMNGYCVLDTFAKPKGEVTEFRTRKSGIRPENLTNAPSVDDVVRKVAKMVKGKVLIGHSIDNDLSVLRLEDHPEIRDTALYFRTRLNPNQRRTPSLKELAKSILMTEIQTGEHSSITDAQATLKIYLHHRDEWEKARHEQIMKANIGDGKIQPLAIADMHVAPVQQDLYVDSRKVYLRPNRIVGPYLSSEEYLDVQFRLMMEDFLRPLRTGVRIVRSKKSGVIKIDRCFRGVTVKPTKGDVPEDGWEFKKQADVFVPIDCNTLRDVDWKKCPMFLQGSLILLTADNFGTVKFAVIQHLFDDSTKDTSVCLKMRVSVSNDGPSWTIKRTNNRFLMMESPAFYEAYKHTLQFLQKVELDKFAMKKYIVDVETKPAAPEYLVQQVRAGNELDFAVLAQNGAEFPKANLFDFASWPEASALGLDSSQYEAVKQAMTQEMSIIQGPPGCGKTFIGIQIVKLILTNPWILDQSPIMIVSYTNHALDQTLELILRFYTESMCNGNIQKARQAVIRVGGGSQSEIIQELTLKKKSDAFKMVKALRQRLNNIKGTLKAFQELIPMYKLDPLLMRTGIVDFSLISSWVPKKILAVLRNIDDKMLGRMLDYWSEVGSKVRKNPGDWFGIGPRTEFKQTGNIKFLVKNVNLIDELRSKYPSLPMDGILPRNMVPTNGGITPENPGPKLYQLRLRYYLYTVTQIRQYIWDLIGSQNLIQQRITEAGPTCTESQHLKNCRVIGLTTTGAVKHKAKVLKLKPKMMIVEEAAHVLEAHVVSSLTHHCEQMIMIGDHKQLRPLTADYDLAWKNKLDVSLMERMVRNGIHQERKNWVQLNIQHRMRPEIARMVCPVIYKDLNNHQDVTQYPLVKGSQKNIFFVNHTSLEEREFGSKSYMNRYEVNLITALTKYFILGEYYSPQKITIIAMYKAQCDIIERRLKTCMNPTMDEVKVSTVDGYQGEENDIIILSFVRSNADNRIGFLKTNNRACVALSRARHGLFMVGNMGCLSSVSDTWDSINDILLEMEAIGPASKLPLTGPRNGMVKNVPYPTVAGVPINDITLKLESMSLQPNGGKVKAASASKRKNPNKTRRKTMSPIKAHPLLLPGNYIKIEQEQKRVGPVVSSPKGSASQKKMPASSSPCRHPPFSKNPLKQLHCHAYIKTIYHRSCGHKITVLCKDKDKEDSLKCSKNVQRTCKGCGTVKTFPCHQAEKDRPKCNTVIRSVTLPCGHQQNRFCHQNVADVKCMVRTKPACTHVKEEMVECFKRSCGERCLKKFNCGHTCQYECHDLDPAVHTRQYQCHCPCMRKCSNDHVCGKHECYKFCPLTKAGESGCKARVAQKYICGHPSEQYVQCTNQVKAVPKFCNDCIRNPTY